MNIIFISAFSGSVAFLPSLTTSAKAAVLDGALPGIQRQFYSGAFIIGMSAGYRGRK